MTTRRHETDLGPTGMNDRLERPDYVALLRGPPRRVAAHSEGFDIT